MNGQPGAWIRPVSHRPDEAVSWPERRLRDSAGGGWASQCVEPRLLDVINVPLLRDCPKGHQAENWRLDPMGSWTKRGTHPVGDLLRLCASSGQLWINGYSTFHGLNDRVPEQETAELRDSLRLIRVNGMRLRVFAPGAVFGDDRRRVQAHFRFGSGDYALWVTDPEFEGRFLAQPDDEYAHSDCFLTISLGEPIESRADGQGYCYKLVAGVIPAPDLPF